jgi:hypothetical protein
MRLTDCFCLSAEPVSNSAIGRAKGIAEILHRFSKRAVFLK